MELVIGWSTEYASHRFSIGLNETDFDRIMVEQDIGEAQAAKVSFYDKFRLLEATARCLAEAESLRVIADPAKRAEAQGRADAARAEIAEVLKGIKVKFGLTAPAEAAGEPVPGD